MYGVCVCNVNTCIEKSKLRKFFSILAPTGNWYPVGAKNTKKPSLIMNFEELAFIVDEM